MKNEKSFKVISLMTLAVFFLCTLPAMADEGTEDIAALKKQVQALQKKVETLETKNQNKNTAVVPPQTAQTRFGFGWNPFNEIDRMQEEMDRMFQNSFGRSGGSQGIFSSNMSFDDHFDIKETDNAYEISFDMAGLDKEKIDVQINEQSITVKGEQSSENTQENQNNYMSSKSYGSFMQTIPLPADADTAKVKTEKKENTLIIHLPKKKV